jgi:hypothetical protein
MNTADRLAKVDADNFYLYWKALVELVRVAEQQHRLLFPNGTTELRTMCACGFDDCDELAALDKLAELLR